MNNTPIQNTKVAFELQFLSKEPKIEFEVNAFLKEPVQWHFEATSIAEAWHVYQSNAFDVLWYHVEKYYLHCLAVWSHTKGPRSVETAAAFDKCKNFQDWIKYNRHSLSGFATTTINMHLYLKKILPNYNNSSYDSSVRKLELIHNTAVQIKSQIKEFQPIPSK